MARRKPGTRGPKTRADATADHVLQVRLTADELAAVDAAAARDGLSRAAWFRAAIEAHLGTRLVDVPALRKAVTAAEGAIGEAKALLEGPKR